ncbi:MAG: hypothetical protein VXX04_02140, partial [Actinomycetota bacterium]|nr:hypothetical protein [Actinomycetota bacterium]
MPDLTQMQAQRKSAMTNTGTAIEAFQYEEHFAEQLYRRGKSMYWTEDEMAIQLGIDSGTFKSWAETYPEFGLAVTMLNDERRNYVTNTAWSVAAGDQEEGNAQLLKMFAQAEDPGRFSDKITQRTELSAATPAASLLDSRSAASADDYYARPDFSMSYAEATILVAEIASKLEGTAYETAFKMLMGAPVQIRELPPARLQYVEIPKDDDELAMVTDPVKWLGQFGMSPQAAIRGET